MDGPASDAQSDKETIDKNESPSISACLGETADAMKWTFHSWNVHRLAAERVKLLTQAGMHTYIYNGITVWPLDCGPIERGFVLATTSHAFRTREPQMCVSGMPRESLTQCVNAKHWTRFLTAPLSFAIFGAGPACFIQFFFFLFCFCFTFYAFAQAAASHARLCVCVCVCVRM